MIFNREKGHNSNDSQVIVTADCGVTLLGGGELRDGDLALALSRAPTLVAADGGADSALAAGHEPQAVIGDMDSVSDRARELVGADRFHTITEQNSTDFDKALRSIAAPMVLALGFTGKRIDHELAAYHTLIRRREPRCILLGGEDIAFHAPPEMTLTVSPGTRVSLFPLGPVTGRSEGLRWPINGIDFAPGARIGTSNEAAADRVRLTFDGSGMLVILPRVALDAAWAALAGAVFPRTP